MGEGSHTKKDEREDVVASDIEAVVKKEPPRGEASEPERAPAERRREHREWTAERADESPEFRRRLELQRAACFHVGIPFEDLDAVLGPRAPACTTALVGAAVEEGYVEELFKTKAEWGKRNDDDDDER